MPVMPPELLAGIDWPKVLAMPYHPGDLFTLIAERTPHLVHYQKHRVIYVPPDEILLWRPQGPSDCTWIVPGTGQ